MQKPDPRTSNIATGLWKCYVIWHSRSTPSPFGNGLAVSSSHCYANSKEQSMTTIRQRLHWLPVKKLVHVHKAIYERQPVYPASLLSQHTPKRCLRSSSGLLLDMPRINLARFGRTAFACTGATLWNNLPTNLRVNENHKHQEAFKDLLIFYLMCCTAVTFCLVTDYPSSFFSSSVF